MIAVYLNFKFLPKSLLQESSTKHAHYLDVTWKAIVFN